VPLLPKGMGRVMTTEQINKMDGKRIKKVQKE
jgi:hypothetical protein